MVIHNNRWQEEEICERPPASNIYVEDVIMGIDFLIKKLHGLLYFSEAIMEDFYEVCRREISHGSSQITSWIHIVFHSWRLCLSPAKVINRFVLLVVKLLCFNFFYVIRVFNFLFRINGLIIKKLNYYFRQYKENQFIQYINAIALVLGKITITSTKYDRTP